MIDIFKKGARLGAAALVFGAVALFGAAQAQDGAQSAPKEEVKETIGDWQIVCTAGAEAERCFLEQIVTNAENEPVVRMRVRKLLRPQVIGPQTILAEAQFLVPLNVFLPKELGLRIDDSPTLSTPYTRCVAIGCFAQPPLSETLIRQMKGGSQASVIMTTAPGQPALNAAVSLNGFTAAFDKL